MCWLSESAAQLGQLIGISLGASGCGRHAQPPRKAGVKAGEPEDFCHALVVPQTCCLYFLEDLRGRTFYSKVGFFLSLFYVIRRSHIYFCLSTMDELDDSCRRALQYPLNLIEQDTYVHHLRPYFTRLNERENSLFHKDVKPALDFWDYEIGTGRK